MCKMGCRLQSKGTPAKQSQNEDASQRSSLRFLVSLGVEIKLPKCLKALGQFYMR